MNKIKRFVVSAVTSKDPTSSKRLVTLIVTLHFVMSSFLILFISSYVIFYLPKGRIDPVLLDLLKEVLEYDFYIIFSGLGFIAAENIGEVVIARAKAKAGITETPYIKEEEIKDA
jgi:O-antigen/teichoic acid export membrane protein